MADASTQIQFPPRITTLEDKRRWLRSRINNCVLEIKRDTKQLDLILETTNDWATSPSNVRLLMDLTEGIEQLSTKILYYQAALDELPKIPVPTKYLVAIEIMVEKCGIADNFQASMVANELTKLHRKLREKYDVGLHMYSDESIAKTLNKYAKAIY